MPSNQSSLPESGLLSPRVPASTSSGHHIFLERGWVYFKLLSVLFRWDTTTSYAQGRVLLIAGAVLQEIGLDYLKENEGTLYWTANPHFYVSADSASDHVYFSGTAPAAYARSSSWPSNTTVCSMRSTDRTYWWAEQIIICSIYGVSRVNQHATTFKKILNVYGNLPHASESVSILISPTALLTLLRCDCLDLARRTIRRGI